MHVKKYFVALILVALAGMFSARRLSAQNSASQVHFIDYQRSIPKIGEMLHRKEDTLMKQFKEKGLLWPAPYLYIRSFKYDSQLEVLIKNTNEQKYKLFK